MSTRGGSSYRVQLVSERPMSATKRKALATQQVLSAVEGTDSNAATIAALEVVSEWLVSDQSVIERLREKYQELLTPQRVKPATGGRRTPNVGEATEHHSPLENFNPYLARNELGVERLRELLADATPKLLREAVDVVQSREPGTKPKSRSRKADMVDYIMKHVVGPD